MRRLILTTLALSFLAAPAAYAGNFQSAPQQMTHDVKTAQPKADKTHVVRKPVARQAWRIGKPVPVWQRKAVRDYYRYGLRKPARGLQWIRVGNAYLLIKTNSGVIVNVVIR